MELIAEAPQVNHPTVVCTAPDGRVFVAEDPMDIRVAADATEGRILCLHPDGRWTVFAENLHAVFGMQYLEGKLYVLHNPKFSVFDDNNGVGANRHELIEQTNPRPWALDWNDHVPANFKLAMDGYFYLAIGDKGLYGARGTDGREVNLPGGGVVRIRPDGTGLDIHSTGVRNILDVAINAEDELFTYDNTDEHDWMGRVTHMVEGGFYGYPHDFVPRRPYTLWMMHDLGGGAACGTLSYNEDALPIEYHGNLFLADFGQRQVNRLIIERAGATYRVVKHEKLFPNPPADFRPVGIAWSADGLSMYICDWQHRDEKADVRVGRLWKLTWEGASGATPKPDWFVPAAMAKPFQATTAELLAGLSHPSREVRLTAQRRLADLGRSRREEAQLSATGNQQSRLTSALPNELIALLRDASAPALARVHAVWALDGIDESRAARPEIIAAAGNANPVLRQQAIRQLGARNAVVAVDALHARVADESASVRFEAATALGRIGQSSAVTSLLAALGEQDLFVRFAVFTALNRIGRAHPETWNAIAAGLYSDDERIREGTRFALRETYAVELVNVLASTGREADAALRVRHVALEILAAITHKVPAWQGEWWAYHPALQPPPERTVVWEGTELILATLRSELANEDVGVRRVALSGLLKAKDIAAADHLRTRLLFEQDLENRRLVLKILAAINDGAATPAVIRIINDPAAPTELRVEALHTATELGGDDAGRAVLAVLEADPPSPALLAAAIPAVARLQPAGAVDALASQFLNPDSTVREAALEAVIRIQPDAALEMIRPLLTHSDFSLRLSAIKALGRLRDPQITPVLLDAFAQPTTRDAAIQALTRRPDVRAVPAYLAGLDRGDFQLREASRGALQSIRREAWPEVVLRLNGVSGETKSLLKKIYGNDEHARPFFAEVPDILEPGDYLAYAVRQNGEVEEGRRLFHDVAGMACISCHRVGGEGVSIGPDLTSVGSQFSRHELAESILYPSKAVREGYQAVEIETTDDESFSGLAKGETGTEVLLLDRLGQLQRIPKDKVAARRNSDFSLMPEGLHSALTLEQFAGLISYLESLKGNAVEQP
jgi:putative heme-binding domain-containing protein